jgi:hypothetical protein
MLTVIPTIGEQRCLVDETGWWAIYYAGSGKFLGWDPHVASAERTNRGSIWSNQPLTVRMVGPDRLPSARFGWTAAGQRSEPRSRSGGP